MPLDFTTCKMFIYYLICSFLLIKDSIGNVVDVTQTTHCEKYDLKCVENCGKHDQKCVEDCENQTEECSIPEEGKRNHCFVLWSVSNGTTHVHMKGCFLNNEECFNQVKCVANKLIEPNLRYCCCEGTNCNKEFFWEPISTETPPKLAVETEPKDDTTIYLYLFGGVLLGAVLFLIIGTIFYYKRKQLLPFNEVPSEDPSLYQTENSYQGLLPIQLVEIKARGRFGAVWKANLKTDEVAVKIFPAQDKQSWMTEQEIFKLSQMEHPNILHFIAAEKHEGPEHLQTEYWLVTAYHDRGSLCDFLKAHTLTWSELCRVVETMARGLMYLHEELPPRNGMKGKPSIAHRDFKSKNVLLKNDLTACIADFGLALMFEPGKSCGDTHGQVGTRRYMAPEVLEGAINFTPDAFLRIDIYACGLVLWELVSRCTAQDGPIAEYRLPFEEEVGQHPSLEDMQESVVQRKVRPIIQNHWRSHSGLSALCDTMEECWDHDAEARLSASCVLERVMLQGRYQNCLSIRIEDEALLGNEKDNGI